MTVTSVRDWFIRGRMWMDAIDRGYLKGGDDRSCDWQQWHLTVNGTETNEIQEMLSPILKK